MNNESSIISTKLQSKPKSIIFFLAHLLFFPVYLIIFYLGINYLFDIDYPATVYLFIALIITYACFFIFFGNFSSYRKAIMYVVALIFLGLIAVFLFAMSLFFRVL